MGYTTDFGGHIRLSRKLTFAEAKQLLEYADDPNLIEGERPRSYLQWVPSESLDTIGWDGNEKFYDYGQWMTWLCNWLKERGIECCGQINWVGEDVSDTGEIFVIDNAVTLKQSKQEAKRFSPLTLKRLSEMAVDQLANQTA